MNKYKLIKNRGFTFLELLIVLGILMAITVVSVPVFGSWQGKAQLNEATNEVLELMRLAEARSQVGFRDSSHGVYLEIDPSGKDSIIVYQGDSYSARVADSDYEIILSSALSLSSDFSNNDINFTKGNGRASEEGTVTVRHGVLNQEVTVQSNSLGTVNRN